MLTMFTNVMLPMFTNVMLPMFTNVYQYLPMFTNKICSLLMVSSTTAHQSLTAADAIARG